MPKAFRNKYLSIEKAIDRKDIESACDSLEGMLGLANAQSGKKITAEEAASVFETVDVLQDILTCSE